MRGSQGNGVVRAKRGRWRKCQWDAMGRRRWWALIREVARQQGTRSCERREPQFTGARGGGETRRGRVLRSAGRCRCSVVVLCCAVLCCAVAWQSS